LRKPSTQVSKLLPYLFEHIDEGQPVTVFHVGPALPDTVDFFSNCRCKLHFIDVFSELPIVAGEASVPTQAQRFESLLQFPADTLFDICLFWDLFNFLDSAAINALLTALRPHLKENSMAHAFSVHNIRTPQGSHLYGINQLDTLSCRSRRTALPGYAPHSQSELKELLHCFRLERSVLLPDSRLELLLQARL
jgi:hypothetical protein